MCPYCPGWRLSFVRRCLLVSHAQPHTLNQRTDSWQDCRRKRLTDDTELLERILDIIGNLPTYGYRCVWALLRRKT